MTKELLQKFARAYLENSLLPEPEPERNPNYFSKQELLGYLSEALKLAIEEYQQELARYQARYQDPNQTRAGVIRSYSETIQMLTAISALARALDLQYEDFTKQNQGVPWEALSNLVKNINIHYKPSHSLASNVVLETNPDYELCCNFIEQIARHDLGELTSSITELLNNPFFTQSFPIALATRKIDEFLSSERQLRLIKDSSDLLLKMDINQASTSKEGRILLLRQIGVIGEGFSALEDNLRKKFGYENLQVIDNFRRIRNALDHPEAEFRLKDPAHNLCLALKDFIENGNIELAPDLQNIFSSLKNDAAKLMESIHGTRYQEFNLQPSNQDDGNENIVRTKRRRLNTENQKPQYGLVSHFPSAEEIVANRSEYVDEFYKKIDPESSKSSLSEKIWFLFKFKSRNKEQKYKDIAADVISKLTENNVRDDAKISLHNINEIILYLKLLRDDFVKAAAKPEHQREDFEKELVDNYHQIQRVYNFKIRKITEGKFDENKPPKLSQEKLQLEQYLKIVQDVRDFDIIDNELLNRYQTRFLNQKPNSPCRKISDFFSNGNLKEKKFIDKLGEFKSIELNVNGEVRYFLIDPNDSNFKTVLEDLYKINKIALYRLEQAQVAKALEKTSPQSTVPVHSQPTNQRQLQQAKNAIQNLKALISNCEQAIKYRNKAENLFRPTSQRVLNHLTLLNKYKEGQNLLRELGGEKFIFTSDFGPNDVNDFKEFFDGMSLENQERIIAFNSAELSHLDNAQSQERGLGSYIEIPNDFKVLNPIKNPPKFIYEIDKNKLSILNCAREFYQINAGSHSRALLDNQYFMEQASQEVREFLDSLRVTRGYLAHNADQRLGAGKERKMHSSTAFGTEIDRMQAHLDVLKKFLTDIELQQQIENLKINEEVASSKQQELPNLMAAMSITSPSTSTKTSKNKTKPLRNVSCRDEVLQEGNLTMNQTTRLFESVIREQNSDLNDQDDVGRIYGRVSWYSNEIGARNIALEREIKNFIDGREPLPEGYVRQAGDQEPDMSIGNNRILILRRADAVLNLGTEIEQPNYNDENSTHYTVLNLRRESDGSITFRYSDSIGNANNDLNGLPEGLKRALESNGISINNQQPFQSEQQGSNANCGYAAVFNALRMLEISPTTDFVNFTETQRNILRQQENPSQGFYR